MNPLRVVAYSLTFVGLSCGAAHAGSYFLITGKIRENDPNVAGNVGPYAIVHSPGWAGQSGTVTVRLCVRPGSEILTPPLDWAIKQWNCQIPRTANCPDCRTIEDLIGTPPPYPAVAGTTVSGASVLLHEVGHCAVGLGHPNLQEFRTSIASQPWRTGTCDLDSDGSCGDQNSFTDVGMATEVLVGADGIRGSRDDSPLNQCGFIASPRLRVGQQPLPNPPKCLYLSRLGGASWPPNPARPS